MVRPGSGPGRYGDTRAILTGICLDGWRGSGLADVRPGDISELEASLLVEGGKAGRKLSGTTVLQFHRTLSSAFTYGVRLGIEVGDN